MTTPPRLSDINQSHPREDALNELRAAISAQDDVHFNDAMTELCETHAENVSSVLDEGGIEHENLEMTWRIDGHEQVCWAVRLTDEQINETWDHPVFGEDPLTGAVGLLAYDDHVSLLDVSARPLLAAHERGALPR